MRKSAGGSRLRRVLSAIAATTIVVGAFGAGFARADYEQAPEHFGGSGEANQLYRSRAMAVNPAGNGGVEPGSLYVVGINARVLRFSAGSEGEAPAFREAWGWGIAVGGPSNEFVKCGPAYAELPELSRPPHTFATCKPAAGNSPGGEQVGHFNELSGVAINPATGDVYVLNSPFPGVREKHLIEVFTATGESIGEGFGERGRLSPFPSEAISEGPQKLHEQSIAEEDGLAVNEAGIVFVIDRDFSNAQGTHEARIMSFEPEHAGNFEQYLYRGQDKDITTPFLSSFRKISMVGPNHLVASSKQQIREYAIGGGSSPICSYEAPGGTIDGMAANSTTGEVFYFRSGTRGKIAHLGPCNTSTHEFEEVQEPFAPAPAPEHIYALAVNPTISWAPLRLEGAVYGADPQVGEAIDETGIGDIFIPAIAQPPAITSEFVANTTSTSTSLQARIDPRGLAVLFSFEYLSANEYSANGDSFGGPNAPRIAPAPPGQLSGTSIGTATVPIFNLVPGTEYVFRVIAHRRGCSGEPACETTGAAATFRTYPVVEAEPPDGRAFELVSPAQKQGGEVFPADWNIRSCLGECKPPGALGFSVFPMQSTSGGDAISYMGYPFSPDEGAAVFNSYISRRTAVGWATVPVSPRLQENRVQVGYDQALSQGVITTEGSTLLSAEAPAGFSNAYLQNTEEPEKLDPLLTTGLLQALATSGRPYRVPGALILNYAGHSVDFSAQYFEANDSLTFASTYAPEPPDPGSAGRDLYEWRGGQLALVNVLPGNLAVATGAAFASSSPDTNAVAGDGRRVFWTAGGHLYMREDNRTTREVHDPGAFLTASPDGLSVLLSDGCLYSMTSTHCSVDLTQGQGGLFGLVGQSQNLSRIYFVDTAKLPGQNSRGEEGVPGQANLYIYEDGVSTRFIGTLAPADLAGGSETLDDWAAAPGLRTAEASPDGRYLAFGSTAQLSGQANVGPCEYNPDHTAFVTAPCKEVFLYDSATGQLTCPSCNPTGEAPLGNSTLRRIRGADLRGWLPQPRYLTNQGRLFFDSSDRLSPRDTNGRVEDVYEYEPDGLGSCARAQGCVSLISPGTGTVDSNFLAMDESGANAFFTSRQRLVPADPDELIDVYDARIGGGFASEEEKTAPECQGEACQAPSSVPTAPDSSTSSFQGEGNVKPEKSGSCSKGKVKKNGKCVKKTKSRKNAKHTKKRQGRTAGSKQGGAK